MRLTAAAYFKYGCPLVMLRRFLSSPSVSRLNRESCFAIWACGQASNLQTVLRVSRYQTSLSSSSVNIFPEEQPVPHQQGYIRAFTASPLRPRPLLRRCVNEAPDEPGVYIFTDINDRKLYIGKSVKLNSRVSSYFKIDSGCSEKGTVGAVVLPGANLSHRIEVMTTLVERIDYIVTATGAEALLLEASMIKQHQPPFNVLLKDDKRNYPYVCVTWSEPYPRLLITRDKPRRGGGPEDRYYGPFIDQGQVKATVALVRRVLPLRERQRPLYRDKPCLNYDIGLCSGPCQGLISEEEYAETVRLAEMVFRGEGDELLSRLRDRMERASEAEEFERADKIKSQIALVRGGLLGSALHFSSGGAATDGRGLQDSPDGVGRWRESGGSKRDVVAVGQAGDLACFQVFQVRNGRLTGRLGFTYRVGETLSRGEVLQACLERYWGDALAPAGDGPIPGSQRSSSSSLGLQGDRGVLITDVPDEIVTADMLPEGGATLLAELLSRAKATELAPVTSENASKINEDVRPQRSAPSSPRARERSRSVQVVYGGVGTGERHHLCVMVAKNSELEAKRLRKSMEATHEGLAQLARMLGLASAPGRIEGYDVSHTGGGQAVASVVCFADGKASTGNHRRYRIRSPAVRKGRSDDYASLREVIARRFAPPPSSRAQSSEPGAVPDLVLIDGGKGQLAAALEGAAVAVDAWNRSVDGGDEPDNEADAIDDVSNEAFAEDPDAVFLSVEPTENKPPDERAGFGFASVDVGGGRRVTFVSLAKKDEEVFVPWSSEPLPDAVEAGPDSPAVMILRRVRDEAHRFALAYHRKLRGKDMFLISEDAADADAANADEHGGFEGIAGLSRKSKKTLVETFGSLQEARTAGEAELRRIPGIGPTLANRILLS